MSDLKLYEVVCSVDFYMEVEANNESEAQCLAEEHLQERGVYDITVSTSPIQIESVKEVD